MQPRSVLLSTAIVFSGCGSDSGDANPVVPDAKAPTTPDAREAVPPDTTTTRQPPALGKEAQVTLEFTASVAGATFAACTSPHMLSVPDGAHTFRVRAVVAGVADPTPAEAAFTVDTMPPDTSITSGPSGSVIPGDAAFAFSATETATFECKIDDGAF